MIPGNETNQALRQCDTPIHHRGGGGWELQTGWRGTEQNDVLVSFRSTDSGRPTGGHHGDHPHSGPSVVVP